MENEFDSVQKEILNEMNKLGANLIALGLLNSDFSGEEFLSTSPLSFKPGVNHE
ncbi:MAG: hypothetical protein KKF50_02220 [Nanoarchaeota archaeon]|nr:hypothetical protein [Nanoarchaeota archaeon]